MRRREQEVERVRKRKTDETLALERRKEDGRKDEMEGE